MAQFKLVFSKLLIALLCYNAMISYASQCFVLNLSKSIYNDVMCIEINSSLLSARLSEVYIKTDINLRLSNIEFEDPALAYNWLVTTMSFKRLEIDDFNLMTIEANAFNSIPFKYLEIIQLSNSQLQVLKPGALNGLARLRVLKMDFINIHEFQGDVFAPAPHLDTFILKDCGDQVLNIDNLFGKSDLNEIEYILINRCNLKDTITAKTFSSLYNMDKMNLNSNQIEKIGPGSFDHVLQRTELQALFLELNKLTVVPNNLFKHKEKKTIRVYLNDNPFHCNCSLDHFRTFTKKVKNVQFSLMTCATPPAFKNHIVQYSDMTFCRIEVPGANAHSN